MILAEDFLHFVWKYRLFNSQQLVTADDNEPLEILATGSHNKNAGPDFEYAKIRIDDKIWAGNVEMHVRSSDWDQHNHADNKAYDSVILHVVFIHDKIIYRPDGSILPTLTLQNRISESLQYRYRGLMDNLSRIPCEKNFSQVEELHQKSWLSRVLVERLEQKGEVVNKLVEEYKGSWNDAFYVMLARNFGFKINALPFELLARSLPQTVLIRHKNNSLQVESLVFGQAGFLSAAEDEYQLQLQREYEFLRDKYRLKPVEQHLWKFARLRPVNFPTIRLAQFAALVIKSDHLFSQILEIKEPAGIRSLFSDLPVNDYWKVHYRFGKMSAASIKQPGAESVNNILLNTVVLFLFQYGMFTGRDSFTERALALLESIPFETNRITRIFTEIGVKQGGAETSQALLQFKERLLRSEKMFGLRYWFKTFKSGIK